MAPSGTTSNKPTFDITLPSGGLLYGGAIPDGSVKVAPMTAKEEKLLAGAKGNSGGVIDAVLTACLPDLPIPVSQLLTNDRYFVLLEIRALSYGEKYTFTMSCPSCNLRFKHTLTIPGDFPIKTLEEGTAEPFSTTLPSSGDVVEFRLLRGDDEKAIQRYTDQQYAKSKVDGDPSYIYRLARHIVSVNGETFDLSKDVLKTIKYVEGLIGRDSAALRNAIEAADCGIDISLELSCPRCDDFIETSMPMTGDFFRPRD